MYVQGKILLHPFILRFGVQPTYPKYLFSRESQTARSQWNKSISTLGNVVRLEKVVEGDITKVGNIKTRATFQAIPL